MPSSNKILADFPGFLFLRQSTPRRMLILCKDFAEGFCWIKSSFESHHETYMVLSDASNGVGGKTSTDSSADINFIEPGRLNDPTFEHFFNEIIIQGLSPDFSLLTHLLADDGVVTVFVESGAHSSIDDRFKLLGWVKNYSFHLFQVKATVFASVEDSFRSYPFQMFQTSFIGRLTTRIFMKLIKFRAFSNKYIYKISSHSQSLAQDPNNGVIFNTLKQSITSDIFIRKKRIAVLCDKNHVIKIPLSKLATTSIMENFTHIKSIKNKQIAVLENKLPMPVECNTDEFPYYAKETRCNGVIASTYTFKLFYLRGIIRNSAHLLADFQLFTVKHKLIDDELFHNLIGFYIDYLKVRAKGENSFIFDRLKFLLSMRLINHMVPLVTSHGDYSYGNIIVSLRDFNISGIIDWDKSKENQLPLIDLLHLLTTKNKHVNEKYLGKYILYVLLPNRIRGWEKQLVTDYLHKINFDISLWDVLVVVYWLQRCHLWYLSKTNDPDNLSASEQDWIDSSLHNIVQKVVDTFQK